MASPALSRSSSPSLESVSDFSDDGSASPLLAANDLKIVVDVPAVLERVEAGEPGIVLKSKEKDADYIVAPALENVEAQDVDADGSGPRPGSPTEKLETAQTIANTDTLGTKHDRYFFTADTVTFLVEKTAYRVHSDFFTMLSPYWAEELAIPERNASPICLSDVQTKEMDAFLSTLYPTPESEIKSRTLEDWEAILRLATMWKFEEKRQLAVAALETTTSCLQKLRLARAHGIEAWIHPAFVALCLRCETLSLMEAELVSLQDVMHIMSAREALYKGRTGAPPLEDVSAYVAKHIHAPAAGIPADPRKTVTSASSTPQAPANLLTGAIRPQSALKLSADPSIEEKKTFAKLFSVYQYSTALQAVQPLNLQAFCGILKEFSTVSRNGGSFHTFLSNVLTRGACHRSFIPIGTQLLESIIRALPVARPSSISGWGASSTCLFDLSQDSAKTNIRSHLDSLEKFCSSVRLAKAKHGDLTLAIVHVSLCGDGSGSSNLLGLAMGRQEVKESDYEQRCANLRAFFASLKEAGLLQSPRPASSLTSQTLFMPGWSERV